MTFVFDMLSLSLLLFAVISTGLVLGHLVDLALECIWDQWWRS